MKNILILIICLLKFGEMVSQQEASSPILSRTSFANPNDEFNHFNTGNYAMDTANERDQYVGTWEYNQNGILFQLKMEKKDQELTKLDVLSTTPQNYYYCDVITFKYRLVKNGQEIYNNLAQTTFTFTDILPSGIKKGDNDYLYGSFVDKTRNIINTVIITRLNTTPPKIKFEMPSAAYNLLNPDDYYNDGQPLFSIPTGEIEMVKVQ